MRSQTPRLDLGTSDPIRYTCTCNTSSPSQPGQTLLFYRYFSKPPLLPPHHQPKLSPSQKSPELRSLAQLHSSQLEKWDLGGRIRVGIEGFNGTVAGSFEGIEGWMDEVCLHWSFEGLGLTLTDANENEEIKKNREKFFKPTPGCKCVFGTERSVRVKNEITPMGVEGWTPGTGEWEGVIELEPWEWHDAFQRNGEGVDGKERVLLDVRNYYESRIGYFVDPMTGKDTVKPAIRRFSQWPMFVKERLSSVVGIDEGDSRQDLSHEGRPRKEIFTYCTGGIRCEKGVRYMQETLNGISGNMGKVYTLKGGIAAYLIWMDEQMAAGKKKAEDSLFRGRNYVFDARGSIGLEKGETIEPVSRCHVCHEPSDRLGKCQSSGCHLVLVVCEDCEKGGDVRCCENCRDLERERGDGGDVRTARPICECEKEREKSLWGKRVKKVRGQGWRKEMKRGLGKVDDLDIRIKTIET